MPTPTTPVPGQTPVEAAGTIRHPTEMLAAAAAIQGAATATKGAIPAGPNRSTKAATNDYAFARSATQTMREDSVSFFVKPASRKIALHRRMPSTP